MNAYDEYAALIGAHPQMVGVVTRPAGGERARSAAGIVLLGAGLVHHVGPNRLTVRLARRLAEHGFTSVRFDHRGIGDSVPQADDRPFEVASVAEAKEVMDWLSREESVRSFVILGICSGAETAIRTAFVDNRVEGVVMINGGGQGAGMEWDTYEFVRGEARRYLKHSLLSFDSWSRALTGRIQYRRLLAVLGLQIRNRLFPPKEVLEAASEVARDIESVVKRGVRLLWVQSEKDFSRDYFDTMFGKDSRNLLASGRVRLEVVPFIDHTFTLRSGQVHVPKVVEEWLVADESGDSTAAATGRLREASS